MTKHLIAVNLDLLAGALHYYGVPVQDQDFLLYCLNHIPLQFGEITVGQVTFLMVVRELPLPMLWERDVAVAHWTLENGIFVQKKFASGFFSNLGLTEKHVIKAASRVAQEMKLYTGQLGRKMPKETSNELP